MSKSDTEYTNCLHSLHRRQHVFKNTYMNLANFFFFIINNFLRYSLNVGSCNKASRLGRNEDSTFDSIVCPNFIHYLCHLILHLDGQCVDLEGEKKGKLASITYDIVTK